MYAGRDRNHTMRIVEMGRVERDHIVISGLAPPAVERIWNTEDSQGQILALAFR